jgi:hypothetical protein
MLSSGFHLSVLREMDYFQVFVACGYGVVCRLLPRQQMNICDRFLKPNAKRSPLNPQGKLG